MGNNLGKIKREEGKRKFTRLELQFRAVQKGIPVPAAPENPQPAPAPAPAPALNQAPAPAPAPALAPASPRAPSPAAATFTVECPHFFDWDADTEETDDEVEMLTSSPRDAHSWHLTGEK
jgi:hypothetical protein